jgi:hypothetical protein
MCVPNVLLTCDGAQAAVSMSPRNKKLADFTRKLGWSTLTNHQQLHSAAGIIKTQIVVYYCATGMVKRYGSGYDREVLMLICDGHAY